MRPTPATAIAALTILAAACGGSTTTEPAIPPSPSAPAPGSASIAPNVSPALPLEVLMGDHTELWLAEIVAG